MSSPLLWFAGLAGPAGDSQPPGPSCRPCHRGGLAGPVPGEWHGRDYTRV